MTYLNLMGKLKNGPFWPNLGRFLLKTAFIYCLWFLSKLIYFGSLCFNLSLLCISSYILILLNIKVSSCHGEVNSWSFSGFLGVPRTIHFVCLNLYFDHFLYLFLSISHFNLEYLYLCKFKLFDEPLKRGLVI